jgi:hypothetical protein
VGSSMRVGQQRERLGGWEPVAQLGALEVHHG